MMNKYISIIITNLIIFALIISGCTEKNILNDVSEPSRFSATSDEVKPTMNQGAVEESGNVNGMHYTASLGEFTRRYNTIMMDTGGTDYLYSENWHKDSEVKSDNNGIKYQTYYYNQEYFTLTISIETQTNKIMSIGLGTLMNTYVNVENESSSKILHACAIMAAAIGNFDEKSLDTLQDIFYRTTYEEASALYYQGNVFTLSTNVDKTDSKNSTMLFRIFPITDDLKKDWKLLEYEEYIKTIQGR